MGAAYLKYWIRSKGYTVSENTTKKKGLLARAQEAWDTLEEGSSKTETRKIKDPETREDIG